MKNVFQFNKILKLLNLEKSGKIWQTRP